MYTKESFCEFIFDSTYNNIKQIISNKNYLEFTIPKKNGFRKINYLPEDSGLALLQKKLSDRFLNKQDLPVCVKGFRRGESYNSFLYTHIGAKYFLRIDIISFFSSLTKEIVELELFDLIKRNVDDEVEDLVELICEIVTYNDSVPQGAYSSPIISNIVMARIDQRITKYCQIFNVRYTRYADDLLFSSSSFNFKEKRWFLRKIKYILSSKKLKVNYSKLKYAENEIVLNGYVISNKEIRLSRNRLHDIRRITTFVDKNYHMNVEDKDEFLKGINDLNLKHYNIKENKFKTVFQVSQYLCGYRAFIISMLDKYHEDYRHQKELRRLIRRIEKQIRRLS